MPRILIIEDDISFAHILEGFLKKNGFEILIAGTLKDGIRLFGGNHVELLLLDYRLPDGSGIDILPSVQAKDQHLPVIIMTSFHDIRIAVKAIKYGAYDFITKPVNPDELLMIIREALLASRPSKPQPTQAAVTFVTGTSGISKQIAAHVHLVARTDMAVLILGESGTGKEQVAKNIHQLSQRAAAPFVAIDCGALSPELAASELFGHVKGAFTGALHDKIGQFEFARGGTLFLDEVGNLSYEVQVKLLRALQEKEIQPVGSNKIVRTDVRIITATNEDLQQAVKTGTFREDLYHRLNEFKIRLPSLAERGEDFEIFVAHFIRLANTELERSVQGLSEEVNTLFKKYDWPGNLRELKNIIKRAVLLTNGNMIDTDALPDEMMFAVSQLPGKDESDLKAVHAASEKEIIMKTLIDVKYNKSKAARLLNIDRTTLYYKMAKYGIEG